MLVDLLLMVELMEIGSWYIKFKFVIGIIFIFTGIFLINDKKDTKN